MRGRRARLVLVVLLLVALTLIAIDLQSGKSGSLRRIGSDVFGPIQNGLSSVFRPVGSWFSGLAHLNGYKSQNDQLRGEVKSLRNRVNQQRTDEQNYQQLLREYHLAGKGRFRVVAAHVVSLSPGGLNLKWTVSLDAGSSAGVRLDQTVIDGDGLVGRVIRVTRDSSTVLLAMDKGFTVGVYLEPSRVEGSLTGGDLGPMQLTVFDSQDPVRVGDRLVTIDRDAIFAPEVPIGVVTKVEPGTTATGGRTALVRPFVKFTALGGSIVEIVIGHPATLPPGSLLPPSPAPSTSSTPSAKAGSSAGVNSKAATTSPRATP